MSFWFACITSILLIALIAIYARQRVKNKAFQQHILTLEQSNERLNETLAAVVTPVWLEDQQGRLLYSNDAFSQLINDSIALEDNTGSAPSSGLIQNQLSSAPLDDSEEWFLKHDGSSACYQIKKQRQPNNTVLGQAYPITAFKEREDELIEAEIRMNNALKVTHIGVWEWDIKRDIWFASASYFTMLGYPPTEGKADRNQELKKIHPEDRQYVIDTIKSILEGSRPATRYQYEARIRHANGEYRWVGVRCTVTEVDENGKPACMLGVRIDIEDRKKAEQQVEWLASHDSLTTLPNRSALYKHFNRLLQCSEQKKAGLALLFVDLDRFKNVNDTMGHSTGDRLLVGVAERMKQFIGESGFVARQGGDEFIIILPNANEQQTEAKAIELIHIIGQRYQLDPHQFVITPSIGISLYPQDGSDFDTLYKHADTAMYSAKKEGRNRYSFFTKEMQARSTRTLLLENSLHDAIDANELSLNLQPQMDLKTGQVIAAEVLLRWYSHRLGTVSPAEFIPIAEDTGQILAIGEWVLRETVKLLKQWLEQGITPVRLAVNLSVVQFRTQDLPALIGKLLEEYQVPSHLLEVELTERGAMTNPDRAIETIRAFDQMGVQTSIDDFGTGYSSLSYLQRFSVYKLKIDQSFIRNMTTDTNDYAIVNAVITLAQQLGMKTIAEGVETKEQLEQLQQLDCDQIQGYYLSRPIPPKEFKDQFLTLNRLRQALN